MHQNDKLVDDGQTWIPEVLRIMAYSIAVLNGNHIV